jgi:hypothetical protein
MDKSHLAALLVFLVPALPDRARAAEDEVVLALEPSYGILSGDATNHGVGGHGTAWLGITETFWLSGSGGGYVFFESGGNQRLLYEALGGLVVALDVLRTIPFAEAMIGVVGSRGALVPTFRAGLGADYLLSKRTSVGVVVRYRPLGDKIASDGLLTAELRLALRFEL